MKKPTHRLIGGLVFLLAASLPRTSDAQSVSGTWQGFLTETTEEIVDGVVEGPYISGPGPFTLTMQYTGGPYGGLADFDLELYMPFSNLSADASVGPQSTTVSVDEIAGGPGGYTVTANLAATYSAISPGGVILNGSVTADFTYAGTGPYGVDSGNELIILDSFQSAVVPEPSAIVTMGLGILIVVVAALRPGVPTRPSAARLQRAEHL